MIGVILFSRFHRFASSQVYLIYILEQSTNVAQLFPAGQGNHRRSCRYFDYHQFFVCVSAEQQFTNH
jgi:hypothetical protein